MFYGLPLWKCNFAEVDFGIRDEPERIDPAVRRSGRFDVVAKRVAGLALSCKKVQEEIEELSWTLDRVESLMSPARLHSQPRAATSTGPALTVQDFRMEEVGNGRFVATFDNAMRVALSATLGELSAILAVDDAASPDDLVGWKSFQRLADSLGKRLGRKLSRHALSQMLWRLRESFAAASLERRLIDSAHGLGARLRLKRTSSCSPCGGQK